MDSRWLIGTAFKPRSADPNVGAIETLVEKTDAMLALELGHTLPSSAIAGVYELLLKFCGTSVNTILFADAVLRMLELTEGERPFALCHW